MQYYDRLNYTVKASRINWIGNDRLFTSVSETTNCYTFMTVPVSRSVGERNGSGNILKRTLFSLISTEESDIYSYGGDNVSCGSLRITLPYHSYGAIIESKSTITIKTAASSGIFHANSAKPEININGNKATITEDIYSIVFTTNGTFELKKDGFTILGTDTVNTAVSFHIDSDKAGEISRLLLKDRVKYETESRIFWNDYLASCPVSDKLPEGKTDYETQNYITRQYWLWWCLLINVSDIEFNEFTTYMSPDKTGWLGTWSNDGPECMLALSLTNQKAVARKLIVSYIDAAITKEGRHSWYLYADGKGCYGIEYDAGRQSNGVACIVHTLGFYIRITGDKDILNQKISNGHTVYERIKIYISVIQKDRDINGDGLIEWSNLWESGWDDKLGCFFEKAPLLKWWNASVTMNDAEYEKFTSEVRRPVTTIVEQVYLLWALCEMSSMAELMNDGSFALECREKYDDIIRTVNQKCWSEEDGFYHDIDVLNDRQITAKSADSFYYLYFLKDAERCKRIISHLDSPDEFNQMYIPMQSRDSEGFSPTGYWSGGYWPREMSYLALGVVGAGEKERARDILYRAVTSGEGNLCYEVMNPLTGEPTTGITKMAYDIMDVVALLAIDNRIDWTIKDNF